ncbi:urea transporter [Azohydromonas aeria]|uniref:urea transporter n=1 Tax=Azohydromonas aeria TaxID=2590212 RepID=UPI0012FBA17E|nr:urea transporter [Azohydromonas aeria]
MHSSVNPGRGDGFQAGRGPGKPVRPGLAFPACLATAAGTVLRGLAQVLLLRTATAGLLVLIGLAHARPALAAAALLGSALGCCAAALCPSLREDARQGLHGYNAALALMVLVAGFEFSPALAAVAVALPVLLVPLRQAARRWPVPIYTVPFLICAWGLPAAASWLGLEPMPLPPAPAAGPAEGLLHGLSQVLFVQSVPAGLCVLLAVALESPRLALLTLAASALGLLIGLLVGVPGAALGAGLAGFNAVLCALALGRALPAVPTLVAAAGAALLSLAAQRAGVPAWSAPFILCAWAALWQARLATPGADGGPAARE